MRQRIRQLLEEKLALRVPESARLLTAFEVARFLRVSRWTLSDWRKNGGGPAFLKLSRRTIRYPRKAFERYIYQRLDRASTSGGADAKNLLR